MRTKSRIVLPMVQMVTAAGLVISNSRRPNTFASPPSAHLDIQYCWALNCPAAMIAYLQRTATYELLKWHYPLNSIVDWGTFFSLVWLLWYAISIEIGGKGLSVLTPKTGVRRLADVLAIAFGAASWVFAGYISRSVGWAVLLTPVYMIWVMALIGFYGHDLWASFRSPEIGPAGKNPPT